jgi:hypothetical protein
MSFFCIVPWCHVVAAKKIKGGKKNKSKWSKFSLMRNPPTNKTRLFTEQENFLPCRPVGKSEITKVKRKKKHTLNREF